MLKKDGGRDITNRELAACLFLMGPGSIGFGFVTPLLDSPWQYVSGTAFMLAALAGAAAFFWPRAESHPDQHGG